MDQSSVVVRDLQALVLLDGTTIILHSLVEIHPQILYLPPVVVSCGQTGGITVPATTGQNLVQNL